MKLYGVFLDQTRNAKWAMTYNKRKAIKAARKHSGATVRALEDCPEYHCFDAPTFRTLSEQIWPN